MIKNKFEIELGTRLRDAEMPVPDGAWAAIQSKIVTSAAKNPVDNAPPFSNLGFIAGIAIGVGMLVSLAVYTGIDRSASNRANMGHVGTLQKVIVVQHGDSESHDEINFLESDKPTEAHREEALSNSLSVAHENESKRSERTAVMVSPIPATDVKEIQAERKKQLEQRNLASKNQATTSVKIPVVAAISADKTTGPAPLSVHFKNRGQGEVHYWKFGSKTESYETSPTVLFEDPGTYTVTLLVENKEGELDEDFMVIKVVESSKIFIPNSFTPNGDGHNDTYKVASFQNIEEFHMAITNQMGKVVYETRDINGAWEFDSVVHGKEGDMFFLTYVAVGTDGQIHSEKLRPIYIFF